jgi:allantoicase
VSGAADGLTDLASRWLGGTVMAASDESFGDKENLLNPAEPAFEPGRYGNRGEIVDGWETRRRREPGQDWALIRLGAPGRISEIVVDTSFFTGNYPEQCALAACGREGYPSPEQLTDPATDWIEIVPPSTLRGDARNAFAVSDPRRFTHVRLSAAPDGGVARLRVLGQVVPDPRGLERLTIDLASQQYGGLVVASSDDFYTAAQTLNRPDRARTMGEGWETRRRRDGGHDFVIFRLGFAGRVRRLVVDTAHFRYNASASIAVYGCQQTRWRQILGRTRLQPDTSHVFDVDGEEPVTAIRLDAFPDGGLSRVRVVGSIDAQARSSAGYRWFNSLPTSQALDCLASAGVPPDAASDVAGQRPLSPDWLAGLRAQAAQGSGGPAACAPALAAMLEGTSERSDLGPVDLGRSSLGRRFTGARELTDRAPGRRGGTGW